MEFQLFGFPNSRPIPCYIYSQRLELRGFTISFLLKKKSYIIYAFANVNILTNVCHQFAYMQHNIYIYLSYAYVFPAWLTVNYQNHIPMKRSLSVWFHSILMHTCKLGKNIFWHSPKKTVTLNKSICIIDVLHAYAIYVYLMVIWLI